MSEFPITPTQTMTDDDAAGRAAALLNIRLELAQTDADKKGRPTTADDKAVEAAMIAYVRSCRGAA